ncbi:A disintegrin and metalloproteinase with thrombospondin motifs 7-like [Branchiostoma floridae x Branchiostoma japonicum]
MFRRFTDVLAMLCQLLLIAATTCTGYGLDGPGERTFHFPDEKQGNFADGLSSYDVVHPVRVSPDGEFISHRVVHSEHHHLHRRGAGDQGRPSSSQADGLHYKVTVDGVDLHLDLRLNPALLAPGYVLERHRGNVSRAAVTRGPTNPCHYVGTVPTSRDSSVAISTCSGLRGLIRTGKDDYFIEPVRGHNVSAAEKHPHLIYKRSALPKENQPSSSPVYEGEHSDFCGLEGNRQRDETRRERWENKHHNHGGEQHGSRARAKRSVSKERFVETLVVVDKKMVDYYKDDDVETYVLTLLNMVSRLYHDPSIGNLINIVLVRLMLLEEEPEDLSISHHADHTMSSFCKWSKSINPKDEVHPNHHDVAILLTRYDICTGMNEPCGTLGLAQVYGMCQPHRSCNINEDTGLAVAFTMAHEIGHNFGMKHDDEKSGCQTPPHQRPHVMSHLLTTQTSPLAWSNCSRATVTTFLDRGWGSCLDDQPSEHDFTFPTLPPGMMYDADHQCRLQYGPTASLCYGMSDVCNTLWCNVVETNACHSKLESAAEGTRCGHNKWCNRGNCVAVTGAPPVVDGGWGTWSEWSDCTRTCGAGVQHAVRSCDSPRPSHGGRFCLGQRKKFRLCNVEACPEGEIDFREWQCQMHDEKPFKGNYYSWVPVAYPQYPCELHCKPEGSFFSARLAEVVIDGTPCRKASRDVCIDGICKPVGCDFILGSNATEDRCGVCSGDGTSCETIKESYNEKEGRGYVEATVIPAGARNIRVEEVAEANNFLALKGHDGEYYINGHWFIQWTGEYEAGGTTFRYERHGNREVFTAPGPTTEQLHIMLLFQEKNPGVVFEYTIPREQNDTDGEPTRVPDFSWEFSDWTECTATCGTGTQRSRVMCVEKEAGQVDPRFCNATNKPDDKLRTCNEDRCPSRWWTGPWQHCTASCGDGGTRTRSVLCIRSIGPDEQMALPFVECLALPKPPHEETCNKDVPCPFSKWIPGPWSQCSKSCGGGIKIQSLTCKDNATCDPDVRPKTVLCNIHVCPPDPTTKSTTADISTTDYITTEPENTPLRGTTQFLPTGKVGKSREDNSLHESEKKRNYGHENIITRFRAFMMGDDAHVEDKPFLKRLPPSKPESSSVAHTMKSQTEATTPITTATLTLGNLSGEKQVITSWSSLRAMSSTPVIVDRTNDPSKVAMVRTELRLKTETPTTSPTTVLTERISTHPQMATQATAATLSVTVSNGTVRHRHEMHSWVTGNWSKCSQTCGHGVQERDVTCSRPHQCEHSKKPIQQRPCFVRPCALWVTGGWSECSASCGGGQQRRQVQCQDLVTRRRSQGCDKRRTPANVQQCNLEDCPSENSAQSRCTGDLNRPHLCNIVVRFRRCHMPQFRAKCCKSCGDPVVSHRTHRQKRTSQ